MMFEKKRHSRMTRRDMKKKPCKMEYKKAAQACGLKWGLFGRETITCPSGVDTLTLSCFHPMYSTLKKNLRTMWTENVPEGARYHVSQKDGGRQTVFMTGLSLSLSRFSHLDDLLF
ncbi:hypothetical protein RRG08_049488 [Elysia crispata]|uniref:Uncharacterized protein n=1 Tax=Elysia crispata TaxID=231223 RepID=A0AAE0XQX7_9GAST|nr:hypothetical protein RRG08_049488 [Elysia crispata]